MVTSLPRNLFTSLIRRQCIGELRSQYLPQPDNQGVRTQTINTI